MEEIIDIKPAVVSTAELLPAAKEFRDGMAARLKALDKIEDEIDFAAFLVLRKEADEWLKRIEEARDRTKRPYLELGRQIDALAKELSGPLKQELARLGPAAGTYEIRKRQRAEAERRAAIEAAKKAEKEAAEKAEAEIRRARAEAEFLQGEPVSTEQQTAIAETAYQQADIAAEMPRQRVAEAVALKTKTAGIRVKTEIGYEVTDLKALHAEHPELVIVSPNDRVIKALVRSNPNIQINGLNHWKIEKI